MIEAYHFAVPDAAIADLHARIDATRWPEAETVNDWSQGVPLAVLRDLVATWRHAYDWRAAEAAGQKRKKDGSGQIAPLQLVENPDILAGLGASAARPRLLIGFAAETEQVIPHAKAKLARKGADWIIANDVSGDVMGGTANTVHIVSASGVESLPRMDKADVAHAIMTKVADAFR